MDRDIVERLSEGLERSLASGWRTYTLDADEMRTAIDALSAIEGETKREADLLRHGLYELVEKVRHPTIYDIDVEIEKLVAALSTKGSSV